MVCDTDPEYVDAVIDTNLKGMIYGSLVAAKNMLAQGGGQIWNMEGLYFYTKMKDCGELLFKKAQARAYYM